jgi:hypothetical protein
MMTNPSENQPDGDVKKGAVESDDPYLKPGQPNLQNQQIHRTTNEEIKESDSDFPEPGSSPEHSGEHR